MATETRASAARGRSTSPLRSACALVLAAALGCASGPAEPTRPGAVDPLRARTVEPAAPSQPAVAPARVVLISIAGLEPLHYGAGSLRTGLSSELSVMPAVTALAAAGAYADEMTPVMPPAPYPAHAALVTGRVPARNGVTGDEILTPQGLSPDGMSSAKRIQGRTLWRAARERGIPVTALAWPSTNGANIDLLLPDIGVPTGSETWYELVRSHATPWLYEQLTLFDPTLPQVGWPSPAAYDALVTKAACRIAEQPRTPGLWLLYYGEGATTLALYGPGTPLGLDGLRRVDAEIETLLGCFARAGLVGTTTFLLTGDRAFLPVHTVVRPNVALDAAGLLTKGPSHLGVPVTEWAAIVRSFGGSAIVYAKDEPSARLARTALSALADETGAFRVVSATELVALAADPEGWFGLEANPGFVLTNDVRGAPVEATEFRGGGGYLPSSPGSGVGFVAWGAGVRGAVRLPAMRQVDVGPTAAALLDVSLAGADGRPQIGLVGRTAADAASGAAR